MTALQMMSLYDQVEAEFKRLLLAIHAAPFTAAEREMLGDAIFAALDHANVNAQLAALASITDQIAVCLEQKDLEMKKQRQASADNHQAEGLTSDIRLKAKEGCNR